MAVAVKTGSETTGQRLLHHLGVRCLLGACYVLFAVGMVFTGIPELWNYVLGVPETLNVFLSDALLLLILVAAVVGFVLVGRALEGPQPPRGLRAGTVFLAGALFVIGLVTLGFAKAVSNAELGAGIEIGLTVVAAAFLLFGVFWVFLKPGFTRWLVHLEEQNWFHANSFKPNQGLRVRRGTVVALLVLIGCGIYTMLHHGTLGKSDWIIDLPWAANLELPILLNLQLTVPIILAVVLGWVSWRVVNWPVFADFLIATEAEMNKVSWTTRRRLIQDTVVVLVSVLLLTVFLFVVDWLWVFILSNRFVGVLPSDFAEQRKALNEQIQW